MEARDLPLAALRAFAAAAGAGGLTINQIRGACEYVRRQKSKSVVSIEAPATFAMYWLLPRPIEFASENLNVAVWVATQRTGQSPDVSSSTDIVITRGPSAHISTRLREAQFLFDEGLTVISSPALLAPDCEARAVRYLS